MAVEKRVRFKSWWLPWVLLAPQVAVIAIFFFWPAGQALVQSLQQQDAFGTSVEWVGLENFRRLWADESYLASFKITAVFSVLVAGLGLSLSLALAVFADRVRRKTGLSFVGAFDSDDAGFKRHFGVTVDLRLIPTTKVKPDTGSPFHGVEIGKAVARRSAHPHRALSHRWQD